MVTSKHSGQDAELFRRLVESVVDYAIFMLDPTGRVVTWNVGAERIKGYSSEEILGRHFSVFYPGEHSVAEECNLQLNVAACEGRFEQEGWRVRKNGTRFWANVVISPVRDDAGTLVGFSKVTRDLTERKLAKEWQAARVAAEQANRTKDEFLAMLGHELRNPLAPIVTALQLMKLRGQNQSSKELQVIERQVAHMMRLVDDLLDASRITRGTVELKKLPVDLREAIAKAIELSSPLVEQRSHRFKVEVPDAVIAVDADDARLTQVFANLLVNAAKYTAPGGEITLSVRPERGWVSVEVRDNGAGIDAELLPRVFDLFVQGARGVDRASGGLGIGLTLVRLLVGMHGGSVAAQSGGPGLGSSFTVRLPTIDTQAIDAISSGAYALRRTHRARRILVVDDNKDAVLLISEMLSAVGHEIATAYDAGSALELARRFKPHVAVLDIGLPVMDGRALAARLHADLGAHAPRLIALTGYGRQLDRQKSLQEGFDAHLVKPVDAQELIDTIDSLHEAGGEDRSEPGA